jgi:hypothetical protein
MVGELSWELERPVSALAVRPTECQPEGGRGAVNRISHDLVKAGSAERESERPIVPTKPSNAGGGKGPCLIEVQAGGTRG